MERTGGTCLSVTVAIIAVLAMLPASAGAATITPNVTTDDFDAPGAPDANCSLREAIQAAVTNGTYGGCPTGDSGTDTILLTSGLMTADYVISIGANGNENNAEDDFDVGGGGPIVIRSNVTSQVETLGTDRIFDVKSGANLTLENIIVDGGNPTSALDQEDRRGGNIRANMSSGSLTLNDVIVRFGDAEGGGGVYAADGAQVSINDSRVEDNDATDIGGGIFGISGGALSIQINRSDIRNNDVRSTNAGALQGGGIWFAGQQMTITDSAIFENTVSHQGTMAPDAATGGGIETGSNVTVRRSLIADNLVETDGGGVERGGAIMVEGGDDAEAVSVINSTIYNNTAGDTDNSGEGGAIFTNDDPDVSLTHVTLSSNNATGPAFSAVGDNLQTGGAAGAGTITVRASILPRAALTDACEGSNIVSAGYNAANQSDSDCNFGGSDAIGATGLTGAPTDNGGFTDTIVLGATGTALDREPAASCTAEGQDQRGFFRPSGAGCDAGAFERVVCNGVVQQGPGAVDCPPQPQPQPTTSTPAGACAGKTATIVGTEGADTLVGTSGPDVIAALGGNDTARGLGGNDLICGGAGKDRLIGGGGKDRLLGERGKDILRGGGGRDLCKGGKGNDTGSSCERERSL